MKISKQNKFLKTPPSSFIATVRLIVLYVIIVSFSGCIGPKKMDKWIADQYGETTTSNKSKADYFTITSPLLTSDDKTSNSTKNTKRILPLIFYWEVDYQVHSTLNPKVPMNLFVSAFTIYAKSKNLKEKLDGQKLEMTINKMPTSFSFNDDFRDINLLLIQINWEKIYILPEKADMSIAYTLTKDNKEIKTGVINIADPNEIKEKTYFKKMKTATIEYLTQYEENIKSMAKYAVDKILVEL